MNGLRGSGHEIGGNPALPEADGGYSLIER